MRIGEAEVDHRTPTPLEGLARDKKGPGGNTHLFLHRELQKGRDLAGLVPNVDHVALASDGVSEKCGCRHCRSFLDLVSPGASCTWWYRSLLEPERLEEAA